MPDRTPVYEDEPPAGHVAVGRLVGAWGLKGHVKVDLMTDFPERFDPGNTLFLHGSPREIIDSLPRKKQMLVRLNGVSTPEAATALSGALLTIPESDLPPLPDDTYFRYQLLSLQVEDIAGRQLGRIIDLLETGETQALVIKPASGAELLVPFVDDYVRSVDLVTRLIVVDIAALYPQAD